MSLRRLEVLQWFALFAGPWSWAALHVLEFGVNNAACSQTVGGWNVSMTWIDLALTVGFGAAVLAAGAAAVAVYRATSDVDENDPGPYGRLRFFAEAALLGNLLFFVIVILEIVGTLNHLDCRQA